MNIRSACWDDEVAALFAAPYWVPEKDRGPIAKRWAGCMSGYLIDLTSYKSVRDNSELIYGALRSRWMPLGATPEQQWPDAALEAFRTWVNDGWRKTPTDPTDRAERIRQPADRPVPIRLRRDLRSMTAAEIDDYRMCFDVAFVVADPAPDAPGQRFFGIHGGWCLHYQEAFLLWHRAYLLQFEQQIGCPVPYWNWFANDASIDGNPAAGLPQAFKDLTYRHPKSGETRPNPLRFAAAWKGKSKAGDGPDSLYVQRDPVLYTVGDDKRAEREKKIRNTRLYQAQVARALAFSCFSHPQEGGYPWANIQTFDPPPPDSDYIYRDVNFDGAYEQPHDNYHGWVGPDMADNSYTAFDPVFWSYHANIDRIFEIWFRAHPAALFTANAPLRPFAGPCAESIAFEDPRRFVYTTIGDIAKDSRGLGYDYAPPVDPDFVGPHATRTGRTGTSPPGSGCPAAAATTGGIPTLAAEELLIRFADVRCTFDSYAVDVFLNLPDPAPDDVDAANPHYVGRFSRIGMGVVDDKGRCITQGVSRILDATENARRLGLDLGAECNLSLLVRRLHNGERVPERETSVLPGFYATIGWYRCGRPSGFQTEPAHRSPAESCCGSLGAGGPPPTRHGAFAANR
jgi:Common central domain of tyrosinase